MSSKGTERFNALQPRLEALRAGRVQAAGVMVRARALFARPTEDALSLTELGLLDAALDRAGIHTSADAKLLRELGTVKGRLGDLRNGLAARAETALREFEEAVSAVEQLTSLGDAKPGQLTTLEANFVKLGRVVKVAAVFAAQPGPFEVYARPPSAVTKAPASAKVAVVEFFAERAKKNVTDVAQKRRDLDLAHEMLLRMGAEMKLDRERVRRARVELGAARERVRAAPVVRSLKDLTRHLRHTARRDPRTAYRSLKALYERALEANDDQLADLASAALDGVLAKSADMPKVLEQAELKRLLRWQDAVAEAPVERLPAGGKTGLTDAVSDALTQLAFDLDENRTKALELAAGAARLFSVEDALSDNFVEAELGATRPIQRRVTYPTQMMTYEFATSLDEVHNFVVTQPGSIVLDLAAGRQMVRQYLDEEAPPKPKKMKKTSVRVYVLDASGSMHGARARFRDAILIAELNAIRVKGKLGLPFDPLYFSFFNDVPTDLTRVDSATDASRHIEQLFHSSPAEGQTDISLALMSAFDSIRNAQGHDPYLSRATVVLVTDGEDGIDLDLIRRAKKPFEGLDISLSFISLGEENADLKSLVVDQRASGIRAFYHHLSDPEIALVRTEFDSAWRTLLPPDVDVTSDVLEGLLPHLEALDAIAANRPAVLPVRADGQFDTLFPEAVTAKSAITFPQYFDALGVPDEALAAARARLRLLCRPLD